MPNSTHLTNELSDWRGLTRTGEFLLRVCRALARWSMFPLYLAESLVWSLPNITPVFWLRTLMLRWAGAEAGRHLSLLKGCSIRRYDLLKMGDYSGLAEGVVIDLGPGDKRLIIGNESFIGPGTYIRNADHVFDKLDVPIWKQGHVDKEILIGNNVWVGARSILLAGTKIGDNSIVAAGSVVSFEIPSNSIVAGNPARVIKKRASGHE